MAITPDQFQAILDASGLKYVRTSPNPIYLLPFRLSIGRVVLEAALTRDGEWIGLRVPVQVAVPQKAPERAELYEQLLRFNDRIAVAKVVLAGSAVHVAVDLDADKASAESFQHAADGALAGAVALQALLQRGSIDALDDDESAEPAGGVEE
jgi:hypothetical protein